jgi:hypothetical protein
MIYPNTAVFGFIMLFANLLFEYGTLTPRHGPIAHVVVRIATVGAVYLGKALLARLGVEYGLPTFYLLGFLFFFDCVFLFEESLAQKLFLFFTTSLASLSIWLLAYASSGATDVIGSGALYLGSYVILAPFYIRYWRKPIKESLGYFEYGKRVYAAFPLLAFLLFTMLFGPGTPPLVPRSLGLMLLYESFVVFIYYLLFAHVRGVYGRLRSEAALRASERQILLQKKYYEEMEKGVYAQRKLLHDNRHHLVAIASLASAGDREALGSYLKLLLEKGEPASARSYCRNGVANAIIGDYIETAEAAGIGVYVDLDLPEGIGIDDYDLCIFFGNTIENAIEACERIPPATKLHEGRLVAIKSRLEGDCLVVRIENSFLPAPGTEKDDFPSSKGDLGGVGLESVRAVVDKYRGCLSCERRGELFVLSALLYPHREAPQSDPSSKLAPGMSEIADRPSRGSDIVMGEELPNKATF